MKIDRDTAFSSYLETALWSSMDIGEDTEELSSFLDQNYDIDDIDPDTRNELLAEFNDFCDLVEEHLEDNDSQDYVSDEMLGHNFWLTRCGHGAGFWDGNWGDLGDWLTQQSKPYGNVDLYSHENKIFI